MRASRILAVGAVVFATNVLAAQVPDSLRRPDRPLRGRGALLPGGRGQGRGQVGPEDRLAREREVRQAIARNVRRQLNLDDRQMRELQRTDQKFEVQRRGLIGDERAARQTLRAAIEDSTSTDQGKIEQAMARMIQIQRQRIDLLEAEQKDLATFLTPKQRAQYLGLRERLMQLLDGGGRRGGPPPVQDPGVRRGGPPGA